MKRDCMQGITIIGGGPAGCCAARAVLANGGRATIYEEHKRIGSPVQCSGLVSKKGLDSIGIDYSKAVLNHINGAVIHHGSGTSLRVETPDTKALVIDRAEFDSMCAQEAESEGAKIIFSRKNPLSESGSIVIGADGVFSGTARAFDFPAFRHIVSCYQVQFSNADYEETHNVSIYLSKRLFPGFFGWVIPVNKDTVRVGLGVSFGKNPKGYFNQFVRELQSTVLEGAKQESWLGGCIPLSPRGHCTKGRVMLVGDAAGQVKALSGGGVYFGCNCASIAGRTAVVNPDNVFAYESEWRSRFNRDLQIHRVMRWALNLLPERMTGSLMAAGRSLGAERFLVNYGDMDRPTEIANAVRRRSESFMSKRFNILSAIFTNIF
ncbi:MAG: NAD(P)/FAD-dependent oxidoreductase [Candidatus Micrarchaeota archaeon]